jgi:chromosome segregation ATPase
VVDNITLGALREALRQDGEVRLVSLGKKVKGLYPKRTGPYAQSIKACVDGDSPLLDVTREETKGKTRHVFVRISERGMEVLLNHLPLEEFGTVRNEAAPALQAKLEEKCRNVIRQRLDQLETQRMQVVRAQKQTATAALELAKSYLDQMEADRRRLDQEVDEIQSLKRLFGEEDERKDELARLRGELDAQKELAGEYLRKVGSVEQALNERDNELVEARGATARLEHQLAETTGEVEAARRRADDYIHEATLVRDNAVHSFQTRLWDRLRACLVEVLDEDTPHDGLSPDQVFFRHRMQEIRDALRELGVPPY